MSPSAPEPRRSFSDSTPSAVTQINRPVDVLEFRAKPDLICTGVLVSRRNREASSTIGAINRRTGTGRLSRGTYPLRFIAELETISPAKRGGEKWAGDFFLLRDYEDVVRAQRETGGVKSAVLVEASAPFRNNFAVREISQVGPARSSKFGNKVTNRGPIVNQNGRFCAAVQKILLLVRPPARQPSSREMTDSQDLPAILGTRAGGPQLAKIAVS
jgi:hypothetical protein